MPIFRTFRKLRTPSQLTARDALRLALGMIKATAAGHIFMDYVASWGPTAGASMLPTFDIEGDYVLVDKRYRYGRNVAVGDMVNYRLPIFRQGQGVKRVLGMPGDYVLVDSPDYARGHMIQVPQGHCWLVGDNLEFSRDSRTFGPVPLALITGKVVARPLPLSKLGNFENGLRPVDEDTKKNKKR